MKIKVIIITAVLLLLIVPIIQAQTTKRESRLWADISLGDLKYEEIQFRNREQHIQLGGMLFLPEGDGPFPAVIFLYGSGPSNRENGW
ncbi:MAG: hypothetical protein R3293_29205, partial [Candidatus Promineifilaceae bacterium]|nr:hypothetical protein [Candidatus Promineifilaceae bacterium]